MGDLRDSPSPLSWAGLVNSEDLSTAWNAITGFVSGTASKMWDGIASIEWSGLVDSEAMSRAIDGPVGIVERGWETLEGIFDSIIAAAAVGEKVGEAITVALDGARLASFIAAPRRRAASPWCSWRAMAVSCWAPG